MRKQLLLLSVLLTLCSSEVGNGAEQSTALRPLKEPKYQTEKPLYCRVLFQGKQEVSVWIVMDGDRLYFDRNANGDLTEPGEKLQQKPRLAKPGETLQPTADFTHEFELTNEKLAKRFRNLKIRWQKPVNPERSGFMELAVLVAGQFELQSLQEGSDLSTNPEKSRIILIGEQLRLFVIESPNFLLWTGNNAGTKLSLSVCLGTESSTQHFAYVAQESLPKNVQPIAEIQYPPKKGENKTRLQVVDLDGITNYFSATDIVQFGTPPGLVTVTFSMKNWDFAQVKPVVVKTKLPEFKNLPTLSPD